MRKLTLKKETVGELSTEELSGVVGGTFPSKYDCTISHELSVCNPLSRDFCFATRLVCPTSDCPTGYC